MNKYVNRILLIVIVLCTIIASLLGIRIVLNKNFIKNYPDASQEYKLVVLSMFNYYEPYIALYNYGNYYYKLDLYEEAANKYKEALKYKIPKKRVCEVEINLALSLIKQSEGERKKNRIKELLHEAQTHLNRCLNLNIEMPEDDVNRGISDDDQTGIRDTGEIDDKDYNKNKDKENYSGWGSNDFSGSEGTGNGSGGGDGNGSGNAEGEGNGNGEGTGSGSGTGEGSGTSEGDASSTTSGDGNVEGSGGNGSSGSGEGFGDGTGDSSGNGTGTSQSIGYVGRSVEEQQAEARNIANDVTRTLDDLFNDHLDEINGNLPSDEDWQRLMEQRSDAIGKAEMSAAARAAAEVYSPYEGSSDNKIYIPPGNGTPGMNNNGGGGNSSGSSTPGNGSGSYTPPPEQETKTNY